MRALTQLISTLMMVSLSAFAVTNLFGQPVANTCHLECSASGGCGGGHYGVCCHEVCN